MTGFAARPSGFFVLRTPLLPFDELLRWAEGIGHAETEAEFMAARATLRARLMALFERPELREALLVASPSLHASLEAWSREPEGERGQKVERALVRYLCRMAGRPMPFGLFAGWSTASVGRFTRFRLEGRAHYRRSSRLDGDYLLSLTGVLERTPEFLEAAVFRPNLSLYSAGGTLRFVRRERVEDRWKIQRIALEPDEALNAVLETARSGATVAQLVAALDAAGVDASPEDAAEYVRELISLQFLEPDLEPSVTGPEALGGVIDRLRAHPRMGAAAEALTAAREGLAAMDRSGLGVPASAYQSVIGHLERLPVKVDPARVFQVELLKPAPEASLGGALLREISRGAEVLHRLSSRERDPLSAFRQELTARCEGGELPLLEVLDSELGISLDTSRGPGVEGSPLLAGLPLGDRPAAEPSRTGPLLEKLSRALRASAREVVLDDRDLEELAPRKQLPLPDAFAVIGAVAAASPEALEAGEFLLHLRGPYGPSGANLLGRFCHADPVLHGRVEQHLREEEALAPHVVFAEVVHLPEGRVANVVSRPVLRSWEIPFLGRAGAPVERQLPLSDLRVSVRGDRVVLRSVRLDREVVPRLTSAHMAGPHSAAAYRFLKSVEYQDSAAQSGWSWGVLEDAEYLPRVRAGRLMLALAEWRLRGGRLRPLAEARTVVARLQAVRRLREELQLPRFVLQVEGDNVLPLDLDNPLCVEALAHGVGVKPLTLREMFPAPDALCAAGPEGRFVHEFVVPFLRERAPSPAPRRVRPVAELPRVLPPGSEWLYAKIYCGGTVADRLLVERLGPWLKEAEAAGGIDRWFFLRYRDPEAHLRLRVHGTPERLLVSVLPALLERLRGEVAERAAWRVQLDTYVREVERYGGPEGMLLSEQLFHADSAAALELVGRFQHEEGADARWRLALAGCHLLLEDLEVPLPERMAFLDMACEGLEREHGAGAYTEAALGKRYRVERPALEALLASTGPLVEALAPLRARSVRSRPVIAELRALERDGKLGVGWGELAASYVHMHVNRLIRSAPRAHELVLYDFLRRLYRSRISRSTAGR